MTRQNTLKKLTADPTFSTLEAYWEQALPLSKFSDRFRHFRKSFVGSQMQMADRLGYTGDKQIQRLEAGMELKPGKPLSKLRTCLQGIARGRIRPQEAELVVLWVLEGVRPDLARGEPVGKKKASVEPEGTTEAVASEPSLPEMSFLRDFHEVRREADIIRRQALEQERVRRKTESSQLLTRLIREIKLAGKVREFAACMGLPLPPSVPGFHTTDYTSLEEGFIQGLRLLPNSEPFKAFDDIVDLQQLLALETQVSA